MSSSGINSINSGPLIIRTYLDNSVNNTYLLGKYDLPIPSNRVFVTSTNGLLAPSDNISVSSINVSSLNVNTTRISTAYLSTVFSINSTITFYNQVNIQNENATEIGPPSLNVIGPTILADQNAAADVVNSSVLTVWGQEPSDIITQNFTATDSYTITDPINTIQFQMIGAGGSAVNGNPVILTQNLPGYGGYIQGTLKVKQGDSLFFTIGQVGSQTSPSGGTSLIHISSGVSTLVAIVGAGGGNGFATGLISSSSGGGGGGGGTGAISGANSGGFTNGIANGTNGYDGLIYVNGVISSDTDGGQGGINIFGGDGGPPNGTDGEAATFVSPFTNLANGGLVVGGAGGSNTQKGGYGGGGYSGGGGGGASTVTSAGGGGGATFINFLQLSDRLIDIVSLSGQYLFENTISIFGAESYGTPTYQGFGTLSGYIPNQTIYTNGDIKCRVLKYDLLDPPVEGGGGGSSALWSLHPAINTVHMNDHSIVECSSIQVIGGGTDVSGNSIFRNQLSTLNQLTVTDGGASITGPSFYFKSTNPDSEDTFKLELTGANLLAYRSTVNTQSTTFLQNTGGGQLVLATSTPTIFINGSGAGSKNSYVGIGTNNPSYPLDINGITQISSLGQRYRFGTSTSSEGFAMTWNTARAQGTNGMTEIISAKGLGGGAAGGFDFFVGLGDNANPSQNDLAMRIAGDNKNISTFGGLAVTNSLYIDGSESAINFPTKLNIFPTNTGGSINIGTDNDPTLTFGSSGSNKIITMNGSASITKDLTATGGITTVGTLNATAINANTPSLTITATDTSTSGNLNVTGNLTVGGIIEHPDIPPVGAITMYGGLSQPPGWLMCNGDAVSRTQYSALFTVIGTRFGPGDTTTTFNVPNMQDRFPIGVGSNAIATIGGGTATLTEANLPSHRHGIIDVQHTHTASHNLEQNNTDPPNRTKISYEYDDAGDPSPMVITIASSFTGIVSTTNTGGGQSFNIVPSFLSLNYIIKW